MGKTSIVINLATTNPAHMFGFLSKEIPHDDPSIVDLKMQPVTNLALRKQTFHFLRLGENYIMKHFDGRTVYVIFRDSEGNSAIAGSLMDETNKTIKDLKREITEWQDKYNKERKAKNEYEETQDTKEFNKELLRRGGSSVNRSGYRDRDDSLLDKDNYRGF